jgi:hypothetical protein
MSDMGGTITTARELDALPVGAVIVDASGHVYRKLDRGDDIQWYEPGDELNWGSLELDLPAMVMPVRGRQVSPEERDDLADLIARRRYAKNARPSVWITGRAAREVADVILAAGYRRSQA